MSLYQAQQIARALLYEGYIRYPCRAATIKNRQRRAFHTLFPEQYVAAGHAASSVLQTQCLLRGADHAALEVELHFLQMRERQVGKLPQPVRRLPTGGAVKFKPVDNLTVDGQRYQSWQEGVEREIRQQVPRVANLAEVGLRNSFRIGAHRSIEPVTARASSPWTNRKSRRWPDWTPVPALCSSVPSNPIRSSGSRCMAHCVTVTVKRVTTSN